MYLQRLKLVNENIRQNHNQLRQNNTSETQLKKKVSYSKHTHTISKIINKLSNE